tara:strand:- start:2352 stop:4022 length:1671 start_codon:yes stop_codon:yes gene_type:complete
MLIHLSISNFTIVDQLDLEFSDGMTVITGETGTGKSIMLDALGMALGDRSDSGVLGHRKERAEINATFDICANAQVQEWLRARDLIEDESDDCILRRVISKDGRSRGYINGHPSTVNDLRVLGDMLIDIHSQHEHQSLLIGETQRRLLDEFGANTDLAHSVADLFSAWQARQRELNDLSSATEEQSARLPLLTYQAAELQELAIGEGEHGELEVELKRLSSAETSLASCQQALAIISADEEPITAQLSRALSLLRDLENDDLKNTIELLTTSHIQLEEAGSDLGRYVENFEIDPARLKQVEERLGKIYEISRKHRTTPAELHALAGRISAELDELGNVDATMDALEENVEQLRSEYFAEAEELDRARTKAARTFEKQVTAQLKSLGMPAGQFEIKLMPIDTSQPTAHGLSNTEFRICTNPGQAARPLNKIASGGELSRISLAIQVIVANTSHIPTLVFDEVDVGIGGGVAEVVGTLLRKLAAKGQILCVTHLPQVAAQGHQHLHVSKATRGKTTETHVVLLDAAAKVSEIARMLGGLEITDQSMAHAQEMFESAQS